MTDLVKRLREKPGIGPTAAAYLHQIACEAADAIERLEAALADADRGHTPAVKRLQQHSQKLTDLLRELAEAEQQRAEKAERELAEARAEIERKDSALRAIVDADDKAIEEYRAMGLGEPPEIMTALTKQAREALAAPAPKPFTIQPATPEGASLIKKPPPKSEAEQRERWAKIIIAEQTDGKNDPEEWLIPGDHEAMKDRGLAIADAILAAQRQGEK